MRQYKINVGAETTDSTSFVLHHTRILRKAERGSKKIFLYFALFIFGVSRQRQICSGQKLFATNSRFSVNHPKDSSSRWGALLTFHHWRPKPLYFIFHPFLPLKLEHARQRNRFYSSANLADYWCCGAIKLVSEQVSLSFIFFVSLTSDTRESGRPKRKYKYENPNSWK